MIDDGAVTSDVTEPVTEAASAGLDRGVRDCGAPDDLRLLGDGCVLARQRLSEALRDDSFPLVTLVHTH